MFGKEGSMTVDDVLAECPKDKGYQRTDDLCWFVGQKTPIDDEQQILAQRMVSVFVGVPDVWVAVPIVHLPNSGIGASGLRLEGGNAQERVRKEREEAGRG
jgi:hypothetical protein